MDIVFVILQSSQRSQILHKKISTRLLTMEVDFCPVLCIAEMPILQAFRVFSCFVWYRGVSSNLSQMS